MPAIDLAPPTIAHLDLAISGRRAVSNHEMISKTVWHPPHISVVVVEYSGVALPRPAVVHDDELPTAAQDRCAIDLIADRARKIAVFLAKDVKRKREAG